MELNFQDGFHILKLFLYSVLTQVNGIGGFVVLLEEDPSLEGHTGMVFNQLLKWTKYILKLLCKSN